MSRKYLLRTLGCKVNQYESQQLRELLESLGLRPACDGEPADLAVVNGCAVTGTASAKTRQAVRRLAGGGATPVVVVGCGATADRQRLTGIPGVVGVWGHDEHLAQRLRDFVVHRLNVAADRNADPQRTASATRSARRQLQRDDGWMIAGSPAHGERAEHAAESNPLSVISIAPLSEIVNELSDSERPIHGFDGHQRAFLKIQDGCDAHCSYCLIPKLRPNLRSKSAAAAVSEAGLLVQAGHREIVLTGIYLGAYGRSTAIRRRFAESDDADGSPLANLVDAVAGVPGLARLRLSSLEPGDVTDHLLDVLASHECCVPHLHLPLQAGSPDILRRMNRQYSAEDFLAMIERVKRTLDRPAISTDVLVGFPGETDADFECTLDVARSVGFCKIHAFPFSPREKTAAARWTDRFVSSQVVRERLEQLRQTERQSARAFARQFVGEGARVIVEGADRNGSGDLLHGRTDRYFEVRFEAADQRPPVPGDVVCVRLDAVDQHGGRGTLVGTSSD